MYGRIIIFVVSAIAALSCVKVEQDGVSVLRISFEDPVVGSLTKADPNHVGEIEGKYPQTEHFSVFARHHTGDYQAWDTPGNVNYMTDVETGYFADVQGWDPDACGDPYFWPNGGKLTFAGYSPSMAKEDAAGLTYGAEGLVMTDFTVDCRSTLAPQTDVTYYDLMYSERTYNKTASTGGTSYKGVNLNFRHALSSVAFKVKLREEINSVADAGQTLNSIVLNRISVRQAYKTATFRENITDGPVYQAAPQWTDYKDEMDLETEYYSTYEDMSAGFHIEHVSSAVEPTGSRHVLLIPQPFDHGDKEVVIRVNYTVTVNNKTTRQIVDVPLMTSNEGLPFKDQNGNTIEAWQMGKRYVYTLEFGLYKIYFAPAVEVWNDIEVPDVNVGN